MSPNDLDRIRASISVTAKEILERHRWMAERGIDLRDAADREAFDIISRIERRIAANGKRKKV